MYHLVSFVIILLSVAVSWFAAQVFIPLALIPLVVAIVWVAWRTVKRPKK